MKESKGTEGLQDIMEPSGKHKDVKKVPCSDQHCLCSCWRPTTISSLLLKAAISSMSTLLATIMQSNPYAEATMTIINLCNWISIKHPYLSASRSCYALRTNNGPLDIYFQSSKLRETTDSGIFFPTVNAWPNLGWAHGLGMCIVLLTIIQPCRTNIRTTGWNSKMVPSAKSPSGMFSCVQLWETQ